MAKIQYTRVYINFVVFLRLKNQVLTLHELLPWHGASSEFFYVCVPRHYAVAQGPSTYHFLNDRNFFVIDQIHSYDVSSKTYSQIFNLIYSMLYKSFKNHYEI